MIEDKISAEYLAIVRNDDWFSSLTETIQKELLLEVAVVSLEKEQYLYRKGEEPYQSHYAFCVVVKGRLKASAMHESGKEYIQCIYETGQWFGETSFVLNDSHTHDVSALTHSIIITISLERMRQIFAKRAFAGALLELMAERLRKMYEMHEDSHLLNIRHLVVKRIVELVDQNKENRSKLKCKIPVSQDMLAMMLGVTRQTLSKEINRLSQEGVLTTHYGQLEINDYPKLNSFLAA